MGGYRQFLLVMERPGSPLEFATFSVDSTTRVGVEEGDEDGPIYLGKPLTPETFPRYLARHNSNIREYIKRFADADSVQDRIILGKRRPMALYEITSYYLRCPSSLPSPKETEESIDQVFQVQRRPLCTFDENGIIKTMFG